MSVTLPEAKIECRVTGSAHDERITQYLNAAVSWVENYTRKKLTAGAATEYFTEFGDYLELSRGPPETITGITVTYTDAEGDSDTVVGRARDGRIYPPSTGWPSYEAYSTIAVGYTVGYATTPPALDMAVLLYTREMFDNGAISPAAERAIESLCEPYRMPVLR